MKVTPTAAPTDGMSYTETDPITIAGRYAYSADIWAMPGIPIRMISQIGADIHFVDTVGKGRWERISLMRNCPATGEVVSITIRKNNSWSTDPFYVDGIQVEKGNYPTTYIDGDQIGYRPGLLDYYWVGTQHHSYSMRTERCRSGGRVVSLKDLGLEVMSVVGLGMSGVETDIMTFGTLDGGEYHNTHTPPRQFTIAGAIFGKLPKEIHVKRRDIIDAIKPDLTIPKQASVLRYEYGDRCEHEGLVLDLPSVYNEGMGGQFDNHHQERIALTFTAPWPYFAEEGSESKLIDDLDSTDSDAWAMRDTVGLWHNYGNASSGAGAASIFAIHQSQQWGGIFLGGDFDVFDTVASERMAFMDLNTRVVSEYNPWADDIIYVFHETATGNLFFGGAFHNVEGNPKAHLAYMDTAGVSQAFNGGADNVVLAITSTQNGDLYIGGDFANVGSGGGAIVAAYIAMYDASAAVWVDITPLGAANGRVNKLLLGPDKKIYAGGGFTLMNGVTCNHVAVYDPATGVWDNLGAGFTGGNVLDMVFGADGRLYAVGSFTGPAQHLAVFNGANWEKCGGGIQDTATGTTIINKCCLGTDNKIYFAGDFALPGPTEIYNCEYGTWNGSCLQYFPCQPPVEVGVEACDGLAILVTNGGEIIVTFDYSTATPGERFYGAQPQTVVNTGSAISFPTIVCQIATGTYEYLYLENLTSGDSLRIDLHIPDGGRQVIATNPGNIKAWTNYAPPSAPLLFDGSDLATFKLLPGNNMILAWANRTWAGATCSTGLYWHPNFWGNDDGTI
jgi:hypothetical protein